MVAAWSAAHQHEYRTLSHDRQVRNQVYNQNIFHPDRKPLPPHTLFATRPVSPHNNRCRGEIFFARIANHHHRIPVRNPTRQPPPTTNVWAKYFSAESQPATPHTLFTTRPVSPNTTNQCRGEIFFARITTSNTASTVRNPTSSPNTTNQCRGETFFTPIATSNTACPVRNPTRQPQHHLQTCGRKYFAPTTFYRSALSRLRPNYCAQHRRPP